MIIGVAHNPKGLLLEIWTVGGGAYLTEGAFLNMGIVRKPFTERSAYFTGEGVELFEGKYLFQI